MYEIISSKLQDLWGIKKKFHLKVLYLSLTFLFMSACLVVWRPLKLSIFSKMIGPELFPVAKLYSLLILIPLIIGYSKLVDFLRRHQLLYVYTILHACGGLLFFYLFSHPVYGISNTEVSPDRITGWIFYTFMESFDAFFATVFWAFADSVNNPKDAKHSYGIFVSGSKIGGLVTAFLLYITLSYTSEATQTYMLPYCMLIGSLLLLCAALCIFLLVHNVSDDYMHGYEQAYQLETGKEKIKEAKDYSFKKAFLSSFEGLFIIIKNSYVLGIFSLILFYETMIVMLEFIVALNANTTHKSVGSLTAFYALYYCLMNGIGLVISLFGTTPLLRLIGIRASLFLFPFLCVAFFTIALIVPHSSIIFALFVLLRAFNYALNHPTREILYIPTTKDIKFKAKTWTDAFGSRIAKAFGSTINMYLKTIPLTLSLFITICLSLGLSSLWIIITYFLGKTAQEAIDKEHVIGRNTDKE